jgi:hypothetical protein
MLGSRPAGASRSASGGLTADTRAEASRGGGRVSAITIVAQHPGDIPTGTLRKIEKDLEPVFGERWLTK